MLVVAASFGAKNLRFEDLFLPELGRTDTVDDIEAKLARWTLHTQKVKQRGSNDSRSGDQD